MRLLGVDFGSKNIGIAVGDLETAIFRPLRPLQASGTLAKDAAVIEGVASQEEAERIVVGIPLGMIDSRQERICRRFGEALAERGLAVVYEDEAFSSEEARKRLTQPGQTASISEPTIDSMAAVLILERYAQRVR
jgi:putative Holliday junction resolvase